MAELSQILAAYLRAVVCTAPRSCSLSGEARFATSNQNDVVQ
uniref:Uncharacterized protein n=1 Tax=Arundo donax TaxID=35708 RepID=A0A0A9DED7_ARUDO